MAKVSKKRKEILTKFDAQTQYSLADASGLIKEISTTKFDESVDLAIRLGVDLGGRRIIKKKKVSFP